MERDLTVLVPGKDEAETINGVLSRPQALGLRPITWQVILHPQRDPGCLKRPAELLNPARNSSTHALVIFDREGCGSEETPRTQLEAQVEESLKEKGWSERASAIVVDPELEAWVWSNSPEVATALGWVDVDRELSSWLQEKGWLMESNFKPGRPKEAMDTVLRYTRKRRSSVIFRQLAQHVSLQKCRDPAFEKLRQILRKWFARGDPVC